MSRPTIADNLARLRKMRDLSQEQLAAAARVGIDTVARIEQGTRRTSRPDTLARLAAALGVSVDHLLGYVTDSAQIDDVAGLRQAITAGAIPGLGDDFSDSRDVVELPALTVMAHESWRAYVDGRHGELLHALPALLVDARRLADVSHDDQKAGARRLESVVYRLGAGIAGRLGAVDLAWTAAERALGAARESDSPDIETAISLRYLVWTLVRQGRHAEAERIAVAAAERIQPAMFDRDPTRASVLGNLLFNAATAAVSAGQPRRADDLLAEAKAAAIRAGADTANEAGIFGPRVAHLHEVDCAARAGDPERALHLAASAPTARGHVPGFWESGHRLRLAAAAVRVRRDRDAVRHLAEARNIAPAWARTQPLGTATMTALIDRTPRRPGAAFAELAAHYCGT